MAAKRKKTPFPQTWDWRTFFPSAAGAAPQPLLGAVKTAPPEQPFDRYGTASALGQIAQAVMGRWQQTPGAQLGGVLSNLAGQQAMKAATRGISAGRAPQISSALPPQMQMAMAAWTEGQEERELDLTAKRNKNLLDAQKLDPEYFRTEMDFMKARTKYWRAQAKAVEDPLGLQSLGGLEGLGGLGGAPPVTPAGGEEIGLLDTVKEAAAGGLSTAQQALEWMTGPASPEVEAERARKRGAISDLITERVLPFGAEVERDFAEAPGIFDLLFQAPWSPFRRSQPTVPARTPEELARQRAMQRGDVFLDTATAPLMGGGTMGTAAPPSGRAPVPPSAVPPSAAPSGITLDVAVAATASGTSESRINALIAKYKARTLTAEEYRELARIADAFVRHAESRRFEKGMK